MNRCADGDGDVDILYGKYTPQVSKRARVSSFFKAGDRGLRNIYDVGHTSMTCPSYQIKVE